RAAVHAAHALLADAEGVGARRRPADRHGRSRLRAGQLARRHPVGEPVPGRRHAVAARLRLPFARRAGGGRDRRRPGACAGEPRVPAPDRTEVARRGVRRRRQRRRSLGRLPRSLGLRRGRALALADRPGQPRSRLRRRGESLARPPGRGVRVLMAARAPAPTRWLARMFGSVLAALLLAVALALWWAGQTTSFVRWALARAEAASDGALEVGDVRGTLLGGFGVATVRWRDEAREVELRDVWVAWRPDALLRRELRLTRVEIGSATVRLLRQAGGPLELPATLALPMGVGVDALGVGRLVVVPAGGEPLELERVAFAGRHAAGSYRMDHLSAHSPRWGSASLEGRFRDRAPFALEATGSVDPTLPGWELPRIRLVADGTLENVRLAGQAIA